MGLKLRTPGHIPVGYLDGYDLDVTAVKGGEVGTIVGVVVGTDVAAFDADGSDGYVGVTVRRRPMVKKNIDKKPENFYFNFSKGGTQDAKVNYSTEKHSKVVPYVLFKDLEVVKGEPLNILDANALKTRLANHYNVSKNTILTYDELIKLPVKRNEPTFNVIVKPGDGDDAASRPDVLGVYLLIH